MQNTFEEVRATLGAAFAKLQEGNPWRTDGKYFMDRQKSRNFDADGIRRRASGALKNVKSVKDKIGDAERAMRTYRRIGAAAKLAGTVATQFEIVGEATSFYLDWAVDFDRENYEMAYRSIQRAIKRAADFWETARKAQNLFSSLEDIGFPDIPNFHPRRLQAEHASMHRVWLRVRDAFRGFQTTTDGRGKYFRGERVMAASRYGAAEDVFITASNKFEAGGRHLQVAFERDLHWYDYRAEELVCRAPYEVEAMDYHAAAARAYAAGETDRGDELAREGSQKRQAASESCSK